nr:56 kda actin-sequestering protein, ASP-56=peptide T12 [swine, platelets, Peptide Partial, 10 aa] [Sus scrofa]
INSITVDNYK